VNSNNRENGTNGAFFQMEDFRSEIGELPNYRLRARQGDLRYKGDGWRRVVTFVPDVDGFFTWGNKMELLVAQMTDEALKIGVDGWRVTEETSGGLRGQISDYVYNHWDPSLRGAEMVLHDQLELKRGEWLVDNLVDVANKDGWVVHNPGNIEPYGGRSAPFQDIQELIGKFGIDAVLERIILFKRPRMLLAGLRAAGVFAPELSFYEIGRKAEISQETMFANLKMGVRELKRSLLGSSNEKPVDMLDLVGAVDRALKGLSLLKTDNGLLDSSAIRVVVWKMLGQLTEVDKDRFWQQLTDREKEVLDVVLNLKDEDGNLLCLDNVGRKLGVSTCVAYSVLEIADRILTGKDKRLVGWDGTVMLHRAYPVPIIEILPQVEKRWGEIMNKLTLTQQEVMNFLRYPDQKGRYPVLSDIEARFGDQSTNWLMYLRGLRAKLSNIIKVVGLE